MMSCRGMMAGLAAVAPRNGRRNVGGNRRRCRAVGLEPRFIAALLPTTGHGRRAMVTIQRSRRPPTPSSTSRTRYAVCGPPR
jgi:hypothetical protein